MRFFSLLWLLACSIPSSLGFYVSSDGFLLDDPLIVQNMNLVPTIQQLNQTIFLQQQLLLQQQTLIQQLNQTVQLQSVKLNNLVTTTYMKAQGFATIGPSAYTIPSAGGSPHFNPITVSPVGSTVMITSVDGLSIQLYGAIPGDADYISGTSRRFLVSADFRVGCSTGTAFFDWMISCYDHSSNAVCDQAVSTIYYPSNANIQWFPLHLTTHVEVITNNYKSVGILINAPQSGAGTCSIDYYGRLSVYQL